MPHRDHPAIACFQAHCLAVDALGSWLQGAEFADERGWLSEDEYDRLQRELGTWPWKVGAMRAHRDRVRLDHPQVWSAWVRAELRASEGVMCRPWQALRDLGPIVWRLDQVPAPPQLPNESPVSPDTRWTVTSAASGAPLRVFERAPQRDLDGPVGDVVAVRIDPHHIVWRRASGEEEQAPLA
jgi:hypothetical protein